MRRERRADLRLRPFMRAELRKEALPVVGDRIRIVEVVRVEGFDEARAHAVELILKVVVAGATGLRIFGEQCHDGSEACVGNVEDVERSYASRLFAPEEGVPPIAERSER